MGFGVLLGTTSDVYKDVFNSEEEINQYISIFSAENSLGATSVLGEFT